MSKFKVGDMVELSGVFPQEEITKKFHGLGQFTITDIVEFSNNYFVCLNGDNHTYSEHRFVHSKNHIVSSILRDL